MRKTILSVLAITAIIAVSCSQKKGDTPEAVTAAFNKKFADAKEVKWDKENEHEYEAEFKWDGKDVSANFSDAGEWMETESAIPYTDLPAAVASAFEKAYGKVVKAECE
ncbi:MAG: PepSY-like domain-containing protein [Bacteroidetes bacterium]|nr:PepSY-like domain-containing protein [Bacteroidota bacterium]